MIRPWYRSLLFWFGVLGLMFMFWAWQDSGKAIRTMTWNGSGSARQVDQWNGSIRVVYSSDPGLYRGRMHRFGFHRSEMPTVNRAELSLGPFVFAPLISSLDDPNSVMRIPYWVAVALYLIAWLASLNWWQRRKSRLLKLHSAPLP